MTDAESSSPSGAGFGWMVSVACLAVVPVFSPWMKGIPLGGACAVALMIWSLCFMGQRHFRLVPRADAWLSTRFPVRPGVALLVGGAAWGAGVAVAQHQSMTAYLPSDPWLRIGVAAALVASLGRGMARPARLRDSGGARSLALALGVAWPAWGAWVLAGATAAAWLASGELDPGWSVASGAFAVVAGGILAYRPRALSAELASAEPDADDVARLTRRARLQTVAVLLAVWLAAQPFADQPWEAGFVALAALWLAAAIADLIRGAAGPGALTPATPTAALLIAVRRQGTLAQVAVGSILGNMRTAGSVSRDE